MTREDILNNMDEYGISCSTTIAAKDGKEILLGANLASDTLFYRINIENKKVAEVKTLEEALAFFNGELFIPIDHIYAKISELYEFGLCELDHWFSISRLNEIEKSLKWYIEHRDNPILPSQDKILDILKQYRQIKDKE